MNKELTLKTDRKSAKEGEIIEITWGCPVCPDSLLLIIDSGHKIERLVVSDYGSTRVSVPCTKRKLQIRLESRTGRKKLSKEVSVKVLNLRTKRNTVRSKVGRFKLWREKVHAGWCVFRAQCKYWWLSQKKWQKALWIILLTLWVGLMAASIIKSTTHKYESSQSETAYIIK